MCGSLPSVVPLSREAQSVVLGVARVGLHIQSRISIRDYVGLPVSASASILADLSIQTRTYISILTDVSSSGTVSS